VLYLSNKSSKKIEIMKAIKTFKMVNVSSYGKDIYETVILDNVSISDIKKKYCEIAGSYLSVIFDRNFNENSNHFTLPNSYNTIHVYSK
jgi:hypothetical protein